MALDWSADYVGIPYKINGRDRDGIDCWGLVRLVYQEQLGVEIPSYAGYYTDDKDHEGMATAFDEGLPDWESVSTPQEFDSIWLRILGIDCHTGIMLSNGRMLHAMIGADSCIVDISSRAWQRRVIGCYRLR